MTTTAGILAKQIKVRISVPHLSLQYSKYLHFITSRAVQLAVPRQWLCPHLKTSGYSSELVSQKNNRKQMS